MNPGAVFYTNVGKKYQIEGPWSDGAILVSHEKLVFNRKTEKFRASGISETTARFHSFLFGVSIRRKGGGSILHIQKNAAQRKEEARHGKNKA